MKYFTPSWHYYTYIGIYMFLLLPYHKLLSLFPLDFCQNVGNRLVLPILPSALELTLPGSNNSVADKIESSSMLNLDFLPYLLIAGTLTFIIAIIVQNIKLYRHIFGVYNLVEKTRFQDILSRCKQEMGISKKVLVFTSPCASTPFLYGVLKPRIVMPDIELTKEELQHVFYHELAHWKKHDPLLKLLLLFINALHWFNPLAYIARRDIDCFCELTCDENVVRPMDKDERRRYCELMLSVLQNIADHNTKLFSTFSDKRNIERRIDMILKNQHSSQRKRISMLAVAVTVLIMSLGIATAYAASNESEIFTEKQINIAYDKNGESNIIDTVINASRSVEAVNALFGSNNEIYAVEEDTIYYSKIYNSFEETKKIGEKNFFLKHDGISGYVSLRGSN